MKKILFSCLVGLGIGANAQYNVYETFDSTSELDGLITFGSGAALTTNSCVGDGAVIWTMGTNVTQAGPAIDFTSMDTPQHSNGQKVTVSYKYKKPGASVGTLYLAYFKFNPTTNQWGVTPVSSQALTATAINTCATISGVIPAGTLDESQLAAGEKFAIGGFFVRSSGNGSIIFDDLSIVQTIPTGAPSCVTFTSPTNNSTVGYGSVAFSWPAAAEAVSYKVTVGTTPGSSDVYSANTTALSVSVPLSASTTYYAKVVPTNSVGDATGCTEISFSTNNNLTYCTAGSSNFGSGFENISKVTFSDINNSSTALVGYEDFTSVVGTVKRESVYPITVNVASPDTDQSIVWIDFNKNGVFEDGEKTILTGTGTATGSITIPTTATIGTTRMRVRMHYTPQNPNATPCGLSGYGQVEDYTIDIKDKDLAVSDINQGNVSVYPNPFRDVLRISDVKDVKSISISDASGRIVNSPKVSQELNLSSLNKGVYFVTVSYENGTSKTFKAIKE